MSEPSSLLDQTISYNRIKVQDGCLRRFVDLKFLPDKVANAPQAVPRFEPKAQATSAFDQRLFRRPTAVRCPRGYAL